MIKNIPICLSYYKSIKKDSKTVNFYRVNSYGKEFNYDYVSYNNDMFDDTLLCVTHRIKSTPIIFTLKEYFIEISTITKEEYNKSYVEILKRLQIFLDKIRNNVDNVKISSTGDLYVDKSNKRLKIINITNYFPKNLELFINEFEVYTDSNSSSQQLVDRKWLENRLNTIEDVCKDIIIDMINNDF